MDQTRFSYKCAFLVCVTLFLLLFLMLEGPITTPARYLTLADDRSWLEIPNAWNVLSNLPFVFIGAWGIWRLSITTNPIVFNHSKEKIFYFIFFIGVFFVGFFSSFYHWHPNNLRMMWDRFPIAIGMMAFLTAIMAERIDLAFSRFMLWPLLALGLFSVYYWYFTIELGREDLRPYVFVLTFLPLTIIPLMLWMFKSPYTKTKYLWFSIIFFVIARISETYDLVIYNFLGHFVSGHSLKHLLLALSCLLVLCYLVRRKRIHTGL